MPSILGHTKHLVAKRGMLPQYLVLYLTDACNLACRHCFYYAELNHSRSIALEHLEALARSIPKLVNVSFTGGEPFLVPHLPEAVRLFHEHSKMEVASIATNGLLEDRVLRDVRRICSENPKLRVNIAVSIDGLESTHDHVRARKGAYQKTRSTLAALVALKTVFKTLNVGVIITINEANEDDVLPLFEELRSSLDFDQFLVNMVRGETKELGVSETTLIKYKEAHRVIHDTLLNGGSSGYDIFLSGLYNAVSMRTKRTILRTLQHQQFQTQCYAGTTNVIIEPDGTVRACEIRTNVEMGRLADFDWDLRRLIRSPRGQAVRRDILPSDCFCSFECQASANTAYNPLELGRSVVDMVRARLGRMENHFEGDAPPSGSVNTGLRQDSLP
jgi:sulfatase maturation enzyme AslB (radical SAM superfamily)